MIMCHGCLCLCRDRLSIMDIYLLVRWNGDKRVITIHGYVWIISKYITELADWTGHSWARNQSARYEYVFQGTSRLYRWERYVTWYVLICIWCVYHLHSSSWVQDYLRSTVSWWVWTKWTRVTYVSSPEMTCYWRQWYLTSRFDCSWRSYLMMIVSLFSVCYER